MAKRQASPTAPRERSTRILARQIYAAEESSKTSTPPQDPAHQTQAPTRPQPRRPKAKATKLSVNKPDNGSTATTRKRKAPIAKPTGEPKTPSKRRKTAGVSPLTPERESTTSSPLSSALPTPAVDELSAFATGASIQPQHDHSTEPNSVQNVDASNEPPASLETARHSSDAESSEINASTLAATPTAHLGSVSQLLTPPASTISSIAESWSERPQRAKKQIERFGDLLETTAVVEETPSKDVQQTDDGKKEKEAAVSPTGRRQAPKSARVQNSKPPVGPKSKKNQLPTSKKTKPNADKISKAPATKSKVIKKTRKASTSFEEEGKKTVTIALKAAPKSRSKKATAVKRAPTSSQKSARGRAPEQSLVITLPLPQPDPALLALSQKLCHRQPLGSKPEPQGHPEVWAESRQALCETVSYFKRPQGGCYQNDGHVYGFLFDSVGHCREYMDEDVIICRAGGSMEADGDGGMVQRRDQSIQDSQVQAVLNDIAHHNPVVVICGDRNEKAQCRMPHQYCVLGWFKPIAVWSERTAGKGNKIWTTVKYRLARLNSREPAWHAPKEPLLTQDDLQLAGRLLHQTCQQCNTSYPQIYLRSWMCLNQSCPQFWKINGSDAPCGTNGLEYNPAFLLASSERWASQGEEREPEPAPLRPPVLSSGTIMGDSLTYINTRGICCPQCGRCNSRRLFSGWVCENPACDYQLPSVRQPVLPTMLHTPWDAAPTLVRNRHSSDVTVRIEHKHGYKISTYTFPGVDGSFTHMAATKAVLNEPNGPNEMFEQMQTSELGLERRTFGVKKGSGGREKAAADLSSQEPQEPAVVADQPMANMDVEEEAPSSEKKPEFADGDLMTAFSMNYGMPYKFVASGASKPFEDAPETVREARRRLNWAAQAMLDRPDDEDLNELLIFAYLQGQKIEYHDDGEEGLGPRIATLSLGGRAKMHLRMKMKHYVGCSKTGVFTEERPIPGGLEYESRLQAWQELQDLGSDMPARNKRRKEIPKEIGIFDKRNKKAEDLVTVSLSHGDIVLMDGYDIQKYLEHKVVPEDHLRFALTCRTVLENHLKPEERPEYVVEKDPVVYQPRM